MDLARVELTLRIITRKWALKPMGRVKKKSKLESTTVADPGFDVGGGTNLVGEEVPTPDVSKNLYVKMKELGPLGRGGCTGCAPLDPPMHQWVRKMVICHHQKDK